MLPAHFYVIQYPKFRKNLRATQQGFIDEHDNKTGITTDYITTSIYYMRIVEITIEATKVLDQLIVVNSIFKKVKNCYSKKNGTATKPPIVVNIK